MNDSDQSLSRSKAGLNFRTEGLFLDSGNQIAYDRNSDVGLKQGDSDFPKHFLHIGFRQASLSADGFYNFTETLSKRI